MKPMLLRGVIGVVAAVVVGCAGAPPPKPAVAIPVTHTPQATTPAQTQVITVAQSLLGTPYRYGGSTPKGFDCSGFISYVYREAAGINLPRETQGLTQIGRSIETTDLRPADIVYFKIEQQRQLHAGIYLGDGRFIHAPSTSGQVNIQRLDLDYWNTRYQGARRVLWRSGL
jgi:cell wall-associated NlpC family hydrolase